MEYWNKVIDARSSLLNEILYFSCIERKKIESKRKDINFSDSNLIRARKHFISWSTFALNVARDYTDDEECGKG